MQKIFTYYKRPEHKKQLSPAQNRQSYSLNECRHRRFRKKSETNLCCSCLETETVEHFIFTCKKPQLVKFREQFYKSISNFVPSFSTLGNTIRLGQLLNLEITCKEEFSQEVTSICCTFIKNMYASLVDK